MIRWSLPAPSALKTAPASAAWASAARAPAAAASSSPFSGGTGFIHCQIAAIQLFAVHTLLGSLSCLWGVHLHKPEAFTLDDVHSYNVNERGKRWLQLFF